MTPEEKSKFRCDVFYGIQDRFVSQAAVVNWLGEAVFVRVPQPSVRAPEAVRGALLVCDILKALDARKWNPRVIYEQPFSITIQGNGSVYHLSFKHHEGDTGSFLKIMVAPA